jgi:predicted transcriptional regulator
MTSRDPHTDHQPERMIPCDLDAERAVLGSCLLDRDTIIVLSTFLRPACFYLEKHAWVYEALLSCFYKQVPPDIVSVADELRRRERLDLVGGMLFLGELSAEVPTAVHAEYYARIVERHHTMRRLIETGGQISALGYDQRSEIDQLFAQVHATLERLEHERLREHPTIGRVSDLMGEDLPPIQWIIPGLVSQGFGYLAAAPGTGKTWMLLQWALAVASGGYVFGHIQVEAAPVLFLALEDNKASLQERIRLLGCEHIPEGFYYSTMDAGWAPLDDGGLHQLENAILATSPALVIIDTLTSISPDTKAGGNPYRAEYQSYIPVRALAEKHECAIIGSWHFNKGVRGIKREIMEMTSGTMGLPAVSVNRIGMVREADSNDARLKSHSKRGKEADLALRFDGQTGQWVLLGDTKEVQMSEQRRAVLDALEENGATTFRDLLAITEMEYNNLIQLVQTLKKQGVIVSESKGVYRLAQPGP